LNNKKSITFEEKKVSKMIPGFAAPAPGVSHLKDYHRTSFIAVMIGTCFLCFNGGYVNGVAVAGIYHLGLTHMTGLTTKSAIVLINWPTPGQMMIYSYFCFIFAFLFGAMVVGIIIGPARLSWGRLQGFCLASAGGALIGSYFTADISTTIGASLLSFSMGIQNAITSNFSALTIRTSHVSGTVLDIGLAIGQCIHLRDWSNSWKLKVHVPSYVSFWFGGMIGCISWNYIDEAALLPAAGFMCILGLLTIVYNTYRQCTQRRKLRTEDLESDENSGKKQTKTSIIK